MGPASKAALQLSAHNKLQHTPNPILQFRFRFNRIVAWRLKITKGWAAQLVIICTLHGPLLHRISTVYMQIANFGSDWFGCFFEGTTACTHAGRVPLYYYLEFMAVQRTSCSVGADSISSSTAPATVIDVVGLRLLSSLQCNRT